jgi:5-methylcytosine-specific restriction endonuclease McrA
VTRWREDQIAKKATGLASQLRMGRGAKMWVEGQLWLHLGKPCPYRCGKNLTLGNITFDHRRPIGKSDRKGMTLEQRQMADRPENLVLCCKSCNQAKGDMAEGEFLTLVEFLQRHKLYEKVIPRLKQSTAVWRMQRMMALKREVS